MCNLALVRGSMGVVGGDVVDVVGAVGGLVGMLGVACFVEVFGRRAAVEEGVAIKQQGSQGRHLENRKQRLLSGDVVVRQIERRENAEALPTRSAPSVRARRDGRAEAAPGGTMRSATLIPRLAKRWLGGMHDGPSRQPRVTASRRGCARVRATAARGASRGQSMRPLSRACCARS